MSTLTVHMKRLPKLITMNAFPHEPILVFESVGYGMGTGDDVLFCIQHRFAEPESLEAFLLAEFDRLHAYDPEEYPSYEAFRQQELAEEYVKVMAIVLTAYQALDEEEKQEATIGFSVGEDGILDYMVDRDHIIFQDYVEAAKKFLEFHNIDLPWEHVFLEVRPSLEEL